MSAISDQKPISVRICQILFLLIAFVWIAFGFFVIVGGHPSFSHMGMFKWILAALTILAGLFLLLFWFLLQKHFKPAWYGCVVALTVMILVGFFDDIGWVDLLVMLGSAIPLSLLIKDRKWYLKKPIN